VFLIDMSDSMLEPLTAPERMDARILVGADLDWESVKTRFDLARVVLARSLRALPKTVSFAIIGFGTRKVLLWSSRKFFTADAGNVKQAIRELEGIGFRKKDKLHPFGRLRGNTNIDGAFREAYAITTKKRLDNPTFVQKDGWKRGCDTIFLLSDGAPTWDDFGASDRYTGAEVTVNSETGATGKSQSSSAFFVGPSRRSRYLVEDITRMNLFRKAEIHTIAMGTADPDLMRRLARSGLGRFRAMGARAVRGRLRFFQVIGPFDAGKPQAWNTPRGPEGKPFDLRARLSGLHWHAREAPRGDAVLSLSSLATPNTAVYAHARFRPDKAGVATLDVGADGGVRVWLNGKLVLDRLAPMPFLRDLHMVKITLREGNNELLVKSCATGRHRRLSVRIRGASVKEQPYQ